MATAAATQGRLRKAGPKIKFHRSAALSYNCKAAVLNVGTGLLRGITTCLTCPPSIRRTLIRRLNRDLIDSYDEELEMEIEDRDHLPPGVAAGVTDDGEQAYRRQYFSNCSGCRPSW